MKSSNLLKPVYLFRRALLALYEWRHPDEPWISADAVRFCETILKRDFLAIEWGSGRSTAWYAKHVGSLLSVEHHEDWHKTVRARLGAQGLTHAEVRFVPLDHPLNEPGRAVYEVMPRYVAAVEEFADGTLDFAVVDGHYRHACILAAIPKLKPGGHLLVDNTNWCPLHEWPVPVDWPVVHQSSNVLTQTTIWRKPLA